MTHSNSNASRLAIMTAGVVVLLASGLAPAAAQDQQKQPQGWFKACAKQQDIDVCNVQNNVTAKTGQLVTGITLIELKGKVNRRVFQVSVPTGRMVPPGIGLQVDGGKATKLDYVLCFPDRCVAEVQLSDQLVASFKKGHVITLTSVNFQNRPNPVKVSLDGFTAAYDGAPRQQPENEKLKEEQDKAKAAN